GWGAVHLLEDRGAAASRGGSAGIRMGRDAIGPEGLAGGDGGPGGAARAGGARGADRVDRGGAAQVPVRAGGAGPAGPTAGGVRRAPRCHRRRGEAPVASGRPRDRARDGPGVQPVTGGDRFAVFRGLQGAASGILVLPNAWDAMSARAMEAAGARAIATTSSGVSWSLGRPDNQRRTREEMIGAVGRIV